jgi:hypothetical protein
VTWIAGTGTSGERGRGSRCSEQVGPPQRCKTSRRTGALEGASSSEMEPAASLPRVLARR